MTANSERRIRRRPRVAHVIDSLSISGGAERQLVTNLQAFDHSKVSHELVLLSQAEESRREDIPAEVRIWNIGDGLENPARRIVVRRFVAMVREKGFDLVHASLPDSALAARIAGFRTRAVVVESLVNISHESIRRVDNPHVTRTKLAMHVALDNVTMRGVDAFHAVSPAVADSWTRVVGIKPSKIKVIPRAIEPASLSDDVDPAEARAGVIAEFGLPDNAFIVTSVGRVEPQKGHRYLLEAVAALKRRMPHLRVLVVGRPGLASPAVQKHIEQLTIGDVVTLTGARRDVSRLLAASDVFAFPSLFEGNGGNAMIEAMAAGLPVITTDRPPMTDLIPSNEVGRLVPRQDPLSLARAILELAGDAATRARLGKAAQERARTFSAPSDVADVYEDWYMTLLDRGKRL